MEKTSPARIVLFAVLMLGLIVLTRTISDQLLKFAAMVATAFLVPDNAAKVAAELGGAIVSGTTSGVASGTAVAATVEISASMAMMNRFAAASNVVTFLVVAALALWTLKKWTATPFPNRISFLKTMALYEALMVGVVVVLFPFFWMLCTSFKPSGTELKFNEKNPFDVVSNEPTLANFKKVFNMNQGKPGVVAVDDLDAKKNFGSYFVNSLKVSSIAAFLVTLFASMAGYAFAKKEFPYKDIIFGFFTLTFMIPGMMYMVPQFFIVCKMGLFGTQAAMYLPHLASVFGVMMMKQYMETIPSSLIEAARIDGASEWQIFRVVILPLAMPIVLTLFLLTFLFHWSNFLWQLVVTDPEDPLSITLPVGLALFRGQYTSDIGLMMAASCFSIIPITLLFLLAQRYFIEGMTQGSVKE
jgi:multiple sugar transport system permease protein